MCCVVVVVVSCRSTLLTSYTRINTTPHSHTLAHRVFIWMFARSIFCFSTAISALKPINDNKLININMPTWNTERDQNECVRGLCVAIEMRSELSHVKNGYLCLRFGFWLLPYVGRMPTPSRLWMKEWNIKYESNSETGWSGKGWRRLELSPTRLGLEPQGVMLTVVGAWGTRRMSVKEKRSVVIRFCFHLTLTLTLTDSGRDLFWSCMWAQCCQLPYSETIDLKCINIGGC